ncbi:MAG TPA: transcriptional repressor NrdR [Candidatus Avichristensenella intestinipullorum]|uniref:Transcriptional repressor NrdR n=1 Tax=Candidatus Avichristensenella intestinipullorum TaxID=2840693 RepID=A0A9D0YUM7_9FIRM|nr:transcriptional repressor NrdR [Candidatus Avichristensenella intestinipullorum]
MKCVYCNGTSSRVVDSRPTEEGNAIRRRRECETCGRRFTTYEKVEAVPLLVIKKDGRRELFDAEKIRRSIIKSCEKRSVSMPEIDRLVRSIEMQAYNALDQEITSTAIGEMVMEGLRKIDEVSYVRFASVYRQFRDISTFMQELSKLLDEQKKRSKD